MRRSSWMPRSPPPARPVPVSSRAYPSIHRHETLGQPALSRHGSVDVRAGGFDVVDRPKPDRALVALLSTTDRPDLRWRFTDERPDMTDATTTARVDAWLWAVRVYKTRSAATTACRAGHVRVNGERAKAAQPVRPGDELRVRIQGFDRILVVKKTIAKRVGAALVAESVDEPHSPTALERKHAVRAGTRSRCRTPHQARSPRHREARGH